MIVLPPLVRENVNWRDVSPVLPSIGNLPPAFDFVYVSVGRQVGGGRGYMPTAAISLLVLQLRLCS